MEGLEGEADLDGDGRITVDELYDYAYEQVRLATPKQTPSKFSSQQKGEIVLRQSMRIENIKSVPLPVPLLDSIENPFADIRLGAVQQLAKLLKGKNLGLARSAREALERIAEEDDSRTVSRAAFQALEAIRQAEQLSTHVEGYIAKPKIETVQFTAEGADIKGKAAKKEASHLLATPKDKDALKRSNQPFIVSKREISLLKKMQTFMNFKNKNFFIALILGLILLVLTSMIGLAKSYKILVTDPPSITESYSISDLSTSTSAHNYTTSTFSKDQDVYVRFDLNYVQAGTPRGCRAICRL